MFQVRSPPSKNTNGPKFRTSTMLLALSVVSSGFEGASEQSGLGSKFGGTGAKCCFAARHRSERFNPPAVCLSTISDPGFRTFRLSDLKSRYGLIVASQLVLGR